MQVLINAKDIVQKEEGVIINDAKTMVVPFYPIAAAEAISGPDDVSNATFYTAFTSTGAGDALVLADGLKEGQLKKVKYVAENAGGDSGVITLTGYTSITLDSIADYVVLMWKGGAWRIIENFSCTVVA